MEVIQILADMNFFRHHQYAKEEKNTILCIPLWYCRQGCAEPVQFDGDHIVQAQMTSCGLNNGPLLGKGIYPAYIACNIFTPVYQMVLR